LEKPILFSWATQQIQQDENEQGELIATVIQRLKPWLNPALFSHEYNQEQKKDAKVQKITGKPAETVTITNTFDSILKKHGR
jgi:hypothetical protein